LSVDTTAPAAATPATPTPEYREVTVPRGTALALDLKTAVASDTSHVEDPVRATLRAAILVNGKEVLPAGTEVAGSVTDAQPSKRVKGRARIALVFRSLHHNGTKYDISTAPITREAQPTKAKDATKIGIGAGAGAALGALLGGGGGAVKGAAIGGAAGTGVVLASKGAEVRLGPGTALSTRLTTSVTVRVPSRS
jgi:type IV secretion system protein VirB10